MAVLNDRHFVLDSWPVIESFYEREPATSELDRILKEAIRGSVTLWMSRINYGEIIYSCRKRMPAHTANRLLAQFETLPIEIVSATDAFVDQAIALKSIYSASFADCFAAALAMERNAKLLTGDKEFLPLQSAGLLQLHWLGA